MTLDFLDHYRRACELADLADQEYAKTDDRATRRAEVLAHMSRARGELAWLAHMGLDSLAARALAEDAQQAATVTPWGPRRPKATS